jgi:hypothetical protein
MRLMTSQRDPVYEEAAALWQEVYGEAPPVEADPSLMLEILLRALPVLPYRRLFASYETRNLVWPAPTVHGRHTA